MIDPISSGLARFARLAPKRGDWGTIGINLWLYCFCSYCAILLAKDLWMLCNVNLFFFSYEIEYLFGRFSLSMRSLSGFFHYYYFSVAARSDDLCPVDGNKQASSNIGRFIVLHQAS